uniref:Putative tick histamine binding protein n=1 Tax=Ixodes ricinus TaxID=34613 RepID=A0A147BXH5_IXORI
MVRDMCQVVSMLASLLFILTTLVTQGHCDDCDPSEIEKYFDEVPDAWRLVKTFDDVFYLVYHSKNPTFDESHYCLRAVRQEISSATQMAKYRFHYSDPKLIQVSGTVMVKVQKMDKAYEKANIFLVSDPTVDSTQVANKQTQPSKQSGKKRPERTYQLLFSDYKHCAVLKSALLGVQVWVTEGYLKTHNDVPYGCSLAYDLTADQNKTLSYDWRKCRVFRHMEL